MNVSSAMALKTANLAGPLVMLLGMLMFALNDAMGKWLVLSYGLGQVILIRSLAALLILVPMVWKAGLGNLLTVERPGMQFARVFFSTAEVFCFYYAVMYLPLADVMTYWLAAPIYVAAASPFLLGETVGWRRWTAIAVGFVGVIITLEPSSAMFTMPAVISIIGSGAFAFMLISGRFLRGTPDLVLLGLLGIVAMAAHMLVNRALKMSDAATVAPLQYTLLLWAVIFGWMFFGDLPRFGMLIGAALIVASGLFIFIREQALKKREKVLPSIPE